MKIAILGTGSVGSALGTHWAQKGHQIAYGSRHPDSAEAAALVQETGKDARAATIGEAASAAEVVVLATPWDATRHVLQQAGDLDGKVLIDCTNRLGSRSPAGEGKSGGEMVAGWAPGARVVKAFNNTGAGNMADPAYGDSAASMFICGDDDEARALVTGLARDLGFEVVDAGGLEAARHLEALAEFWVYLAYRQGLGQDIAFKLLKR
jgi:8-hydroxy-5-deazaflavin:NADPH oxidoreductase